MKVKEHTKVNLKYEVVADNEVVDKADNATLFVGFRMLIPGFEKNLLGMEKDEEKEFVVEPNDGYGEYKLELVQKVPKTQFKPEEQEHLIKGRMLQMYANGMPVIAVVKDVDADNVTFDFNHPLAGKTLHFKIKVLDVAEATEEDLHQHNVPHSH